jgi:hypothetical protein
MQSLLKSKSTLGILFLFILGMFVYNMFFRGEAAPLESADSAASVGSDLVKLSDELTRAQLSQDLFQLPTYRSLTDFTTPLPQQEIGRENPFDVIGR